MKIAFVTDYLGTLGGTEASLCQSVACLRREGHDVAVFVFPREGPPHAHWLDALAAAGANVVILAPEDAARAAEDAWLRLAAWRVDIVHGIPMGRFLLSCLVAPGRLACPVVATETSEGSKRCTWYDDATVEILALVDAVVAPCASVAANLRAQFGYGGRIAVIPHLLPVPEPEIRPIDPRKRERLHDLLSVTRLRFEKGIPFLLAAMALPTTPAACRLTVYGDMFEEEGARALVQALLLESRVRLAGPFLGPAAMSRIYAAHPIVLLSSLFEGLPLALLNAIARGCVVVATDVGGVREILGDDEAGIVVPPADPTAMSLAIRTLVADPDRLQRCSGAATAIFRERFHLSRTLPQTVAFYREMVG